MIDDEQNLGYLSFFMIAYSKLQVGFPLFFHFKYKLFAGTQGYLEDEKC